MLPLRVPSNNVIKESLSYRRNILKYFLEEEGMDIQGMSDEELEEACEVFTLPSGGYLIVEG